jgi:Xaa-Pro aminopeptidase
LQANLLPGILMIPTAAEQVRNQDCLYPYRFDSDFYYLTGFTEPDAVLVQVINDTPRTILFCREKHPEREIWEGFIHGSALAAEKFAIDQAYSITELETQLLALLKNQPRIYCALGKNPHWDKRLISLLQQLRQTRQMIPQIIDIQPVLAQMRLIKDHDEIALLKKAGQINAKAHRRAMQMTQPGLFEYSIEAEILHEYYRHGCRAIAYNTIVASGANACTLHYIDNTMPLQNGDLLLIDAGCEWQGYASDVTRTFPINGQFSAVQKAVYEIVLSAQQAAIAQMQPGHTYQAPAESALTVLAQGLIDLGLCQGSVTGVIESGAYRQFYMHKIGHWMGLDVHDVGDTMDTSLVLMPGMVMTIEPGLYIRPANNVPPHLANIG